MFTPGLEQVVHTLRRAHRSGRLAFPPQLPEGAGHRNKREPAHLWIRRCIQDAGGVHRVAVEENLALILVIKLDEQRLRYANLQALWTEVPLRTFADGDGTQQHQYFRLDYDPTALGPLLKESLPHVHIDGDGEPRFSVPMAEANDPVGWFLEFVYRNFLYDEWIAWVEGEWDDWCSLAKRPNRWVRLVQAFKQSQIRIIEADPDLCEDLRQLKRCVSTRRRAFLPLDVDPVRLELFGHDSPNPKHT